MAPDLISLRLPFNGGPGPGGADRGPQNGKEQRRRAAQGGSSLEVWRCGGVEAGRGTQCGAECLSVAGRGRVQACGRGLVWLQWHGRMERCRAGKPLPSLASNDKLFLVDRGAAAAWRNADLIGQSPSAGRQGER